MSDEKVTAWSVKYWETAGIEKTDDWRSYESAGKQYLRLPGRAYWERVGRDVFFSESEAVARAVQLVNKKIAATEKKLDKLRAMTFEVKGGGR